MTKETDYSKYNNVVPFKSKGTSFPKKALKLGMSRGVWDGHVLDKTIDLTATYHLIYTNENNSTYRIILTGKHLQIGIAFLKQIQEERDVSEIEAANYYCLSPVAAFCDYAASNQQLTDKTVGFEDTLNKIEMGCPETRDDMVDYISAFMAGYRDKFTNNYTMEMHVTGDAEVGVIFT